MSIKTKITGAAVIVGLVITSFLFYKDAKTEKEKRINIETSIRLKEDSNNIQYRKYKDSITIANKEIIEANMNTFKTLFKDVKADFEATTGRNIKNLQSALKTQINSKETIYVVNSDTLINDSIRATKFDYKDQFNTIKGIVKHDSTNLIIEHNLYLTEYDYLTRNNSPWYTPWKWGKKLVVDIRSSNPKDSIVKLEKIKIIK